MGWFMKAIRTINKIIDPVENVKGIVQHVKDVPGFFKLTGTLLEAGVVNLEENIARGYRKITGTGGRPVFDPKEGPLVSSVTLQDLVALSSEVYKPDGGGREGYDRVTTKQVKDLQFSIYQNQEDGHVVVSFRGSSNFDNWKKRNLHMRAVDDGFGNKVHEGFKSAWDDLKPVVNAELESIFPGGQFTNNVTFTGHSLGGAISQLATADYMNSQNPRLIDTVTFASPTVGDKGFNDRIVPGHHMRVVDPRDSVPKVVQKLQPDFVPPELATRVIALGDKDKRINDRVKKDAIRFGIELSFDIGVALLLAYAPEARGAAVFEEEAILAAEEVAGVSKLAEEEAVAETFVDVIGGVAGEDTFSTAELEDIRHLFRSDFRAQITEQLKLIRSSSLKENIVRAGKSIDWEKTIQVTLAKAGISVQASNLITPFVMENIHGEVDEEGVKFLLDNSFEFMYGAAQAHPVGTYIDNVNTQFGNREDNARADMFNNYQKNLNKQGVQEELVRFMTEEELEDYQENFAHERELEEKKDREFDERLDRFLEDDFIVDDEDDEDDEDDDDDVEEDVLDDVDTHNLGGIESNVINGRPLDVFPNRTGRKGDGSTIFSVRTEQGQVLSYTGPSHSASTTTLYGKWTGIAPFANALPVKVSRSSGFGGKAFSALDTFSMAYLINSFSDGYHNKEADDMYQKRIRAAIHNGYISDAVDHDEYRVALLILKEFEEKGHLFGAEDLSVTSRGNMLSELKVMTRGALNDSVDNVNGVNVSFSRGEKRKIERAFETSEGQGVAREIVTRSNKRLRSQDVSGTNVLENGMDTIDFNMRVLRSLGLESSVEYDILDNASKQAANGYKTALNVQSELEDIITERRVPIDGLFSNPLGSLVTHDQFRDEDLNTSGNEEYLKDKLTLAIVSSIL